MNRSLPGNPVKAANDPGANRGNSPKKTPPAKGRASNHRSRPLKREEISIPFTFPSLHVKQDGYTISSLYVLKIYTDHSETELTRVTIGNSRSASYESLWRPASNTRSIFFKRLSRAF